MKLKLLLVSLQMLMLHLKRELILQDYNKPVQL